MSGSGLRRHQDAEITDTDDEPLDPRPQPGPDPITMLTSAETDNRGCRM